MHLYKNPGPIHYLQKSWDFMTQYYIKIVDNTYSVLLQILNFNVKSYDTIEYNML